MKRQFLLLSLLVASCITQAGDGGFFDTTGEILGLAAVAAVTWGLAHKNQLTNNAQRVWTQSVNCANSAKNVVSSSVRNKTSSLKSWFDQKIEEFTKRKTEVRIEPYNFSGNDSDVDDDSNSTASSSRSELPAFGDEDRSDDANSEAQQPVVPGAAGAVDQNLAAAARTPLPFASTSGLGSSVDNDAPGDEGAAARIPLPSASTSGLGSSVDNDSTSTASSSRSESPSPEHRPGNEGSDPAVVDSKAAVSVGVVDNNSANAQTQQPEAPVNNQVASTKLAEPRGSYFTLGDRCIYGAIVVFVFAAIIAGHNKVQHAAQLAL